MSSSLRPDVRRASRTPWHLASAVVMAMAMLALGLVAAGAPADAPPAGAFTPVEVLRIDFEDGGVPFGGDGGTFTNVVDPLAVDGGNRVLQLDVTADWHGLQIPGRYLSAGATYRVEARVLDGTTGGTARFVGQTDDHAWAWIGDTPISPETWTTVVGEFQARSSGVDHVRLVAHHAGTFFADDVVLTRVAVGGAAQPAVEEDVAFERLAWDFEDGTSQGWFGRNAADGFGVVTPGADSSHAIGVWDRTDQGSGPMVEIDQVVRPGQRLAFSADVRFTESVSDDLVTLSIQTGPSSFTNLITNMAVDADGAWARIEGVFVVPAFTTMARLYLESPWVGGARGETAAFQVDNVVIDVPAPLAWDRDLVPFRETLRGINAGVAVDSRDLVDEMAEIIAHHFSHLVGENHMKPDAW
jgi:endo-1,4-beta-xylanase